MRNTLNRLVDKPNFALRNFSHGASTLAAVRRIASIASCSGEAKGRVCWICLAKLLDTGETLSVKTTIVKRNFNWHDCPPAMRFATARRFGTWPACEPGRWTKDWMHRRPPPENLTAGNKSIQIVSVVDDCEASSRRE